MFVSFLVYSIQHSSIKLYLSAVRSLHIEQGFSDPLLNCLQLQQVLRGDKRSQGSPAAQRLPITDSLLLVIHRALDLNIFDHCAFWAACMLGYFGFLHAAEFTVPNLASFSPVFHLSVADIAVDSLQSPTCLCVWIKASKTDPFRQGCCIHIGLGRAPLCTVHALLAYLSMRGNVTGPLFLLANGQLLSRSILTDWLQQIFSTAGIEGNFSSHSFRIGAATVAARNSIPDHLIQALGRWTSNAYQLYIRTPSEALTGISVSWLDIVCPCHWLSTAPSTLRSSLAPNIIAWGLPCSFWRCSHCQLLSFGKCVFFSMHRRFHFTPVRWPLLFQAPRRSRLGGGRLQGCHGYLLLMLEHCPAPPTL